MLERNHPLRINALRLPVAMISVQSVLHLTTSSKKFKKPLDNSPRVWYNKYIRWSEAIPINLIKDSGCDGDRTGTHRLAIGLECKYRTKAVAIVKPCTISRKSHKEAERFRG